MALAVVPHGGWAFGSVSLFMDLSSERIHSLLPVFLVSTLGVSALAVGLIEGIAEATAAIAKVFSGALSDWIGRRKPLVLLATDWLLGSKPLFPLATGVAMVLAARFIDRVDTGMLDSPDRIRVVEDIRQAGEGPSVG